MRQVKYYPPEELIVVEVVAPNGRTVGLCWPRERATEAELTAYEARTRLNEMVKKKLPETRVKTRKKRAS